MKTTEMNHSKLLIHIGLHKTGSTWMQNDWFVNDDLPFICPWARNSLLNYIINPHPLIFDSEQVQLKYQETIEKLHALKKTVVFSHERFSGCPGSGGFDTVEIAGRLKKCFPYGKILIFIRKQEDLIYTYYKQYIRDGGGSTLEEFLYPPQPYMVRVPYFAAEFYKFHNIIKLYQDLFGEKQVLVVTYENLKHNPQEVLGKVLEFTGHDKGLSKKLVNRETNVSITSLQTIKIQKLNRYHLRNQFNPNPIWPLSPKSYEKYLGKILSEKNFIQTPKSKDIDARWKKIIKEYSTGKFAESNCITQQLTGIDLAEYGYTL